MNGHKEGGEPSCGAFPDSIFGVAPTGSTIPGSMNTQEEGKKEATDEGSEDGDDVEENEGRDDQWEDTHSDFDMEVSSNQTEEETRTTRKSSGSSKRSGSLRTKPPPPLPSVVCH
ncbi:hypothetical protein BaRGS_00002611 [Batillaria attramentaria]|uniref:Uncharacterized protein n=1 Tax=Batillaria attramentaria TaxID=370345 RepID=A0ABD0M260_9CAEN